MEKQYEDMIIINIKEKEKMRNYFKTILQIEMVIILGFVLLSGPAIYAQNFTGLTQPENTSQQAAIDNNAQSAGQNLAQDQTVTPQIPSALIGLADTSTYTLGVDDVIEITVARHPEVSGQYIINKEGKIQYGFVGDIVVVGLTKKDVKDLLVKNLTTYIVTPDITVTIVGYNSKVVYVIGEVGSPGRIYMKGDTITVHEALLQAGLPLLSAAMRRCPLITPSLNGNAVHKSVDVFKLLYEGDLRENLVMKPGDTLYVPATVLAKAMRVISPVTEPIQSTAQGARPVAAAASGGAAGF